MRLLAVLFFLMSVSVLFDTGMTSRPRCVIPSVDTESVPPKVMEFNQCMHSHECYSGYCNGMTCAKDSCAKGKVGGGGDCQQDASCYSGYCYGRKCQPDSPVQGKVDVGGHCVNNDHCYSNRCQSGICENR